jgi:hypothetical protein
MSNYKLAILELYSPYKHGTLEYKYQDIYNNYIILDIIDINEFYNDLPNINKDIEMLYEMYDMFSSQVSENPDIEKIHPSIRNYCNIIKNPKQLELRIIEPISKCIGPHEYDSYSLACDKTHWIKLIQRSWKKCLQKRMSAKKNHKNLKYKEINGKYPDDVNVKFRLKIN